MATCLIAQGCAIIEHIFVGDFVTMRPIQLPEASLESKVYCSARGIQLVRPDARNSSARSPLFQDTGFHLADLLKQPFNIYFFYSDSIVAVVNKGNNQFADSSIDHPVGKHVYEVLRSKKAVQHVIKNNSEILSSKKAAFFNEESDPEDEINTHCVSLKMPWYSDDKIVGVFGCSVLLNRQSIDQTLQQLNQLSTIIPQFSHSPIKSAAHPIMQNYQLTPREIEILKYVVNGNTAKRIGNILNLSHRTIESHIHNIKIKTNSGSKSELINKTIDIFYTKDQ